jgi:uncharacterized protein YmfQ (DUF2313 family)
MTTNGAIPPDRHVRRSGDDYAVALAQLLPQGQAWPRSPQSVLRQAINGLANYFGFVDGRAADLLERESDPRATIELLPDWERNWGLPDPCFTTPQTIGDRQQTLVRRMTLLGGQSRAWFAEVAAEIGYPLAIREFSPFMVGISRCGDTRALDDGVHYRWEIGSSDMRFYWTTAPTQATLTWFDALLAVRHRPLSQDRNARRPAVHFDRWKPAHTIIVFDFTNLGPDANALLREDGFMALRQDSSLELRE